MTTPGTPRPVRSYVRREWPLLVGLATTTLLAVFGRGWLAELGPAAMTLLWLTLGVSMLTLARERPAHYWGVHAILFLGVSDAHLREVKGTSIATRGQSTAGALETVGCVRR